MYLLKYCYVNIAGNVVDDIYSLLWYQIDKILNEKHKTIIYY